MYVCVHNTRLLFYAANIGGLLGLFMGFSVVSLVELFFYIGLRPFFRLPQNVASRRMSNTISKLVSAKRKWPVHWIRNLDEHQAFGPMFRKPNFNRARKRNPVACTNQSDVIFPYLE